MNYKNVYEYKVVTFYHGSPIPYRKLNQAGSEGYRVVGQATLFGTIYTGLSSSLKSTGTQIIMERATVVADLPVAVEGTKMKDKIEAQPEISLRNDLKQIDLQKWWAEHDDEGRRIMPCGCTLKHGSAMASLAGEWYCLTCGARSVNDD